MSAISAPYSGIPRVNLMPRSEIVRRERDRLVRVWVWIVLGSIVLALLIIAGAFAFKFLADQRLAAEQARTNELLTEVASLSDVSHALATESELSDFRADAMVSDLAWKPVLTKITGVLPSGAILTGFDFTLGGAAQGKDPKVEQGLVGTVSMNSPTPLDIVSIVRSLRKVDGVLFADGQSVTSSQVSQGRYAYLINVQFDQTVYSNKYSPQEGGK